MSIHVTIPPLAKQKGTEVSRYVDTLTKPQGSLGRLEEIAIALAEMTGESFPTVMPPGVIVFAADHGIAKEGVSAFPQEVTSQMVYNFLTGGAAINVFSRQIEAKFKIIDIGVANDIDGEGLVNRKIKYGTANFLQQDAMSYTEAEQAVKVGYEEAEKFIKDGVKCLILGEMGIGNTTTSSAILAVLTDENVTEIVGHGTGISDDGKIKKIEAIKQGIVKRNPNSTEVYDILSKIGGLEIAGMTGAMLAAAHYRVPILVDGFICTIAACLAKVIDPAVVDYMIVGHQSVEPGHKIAIEFLGKKPLVNLGLRLGEGSGAAVAFPIVKSATLMLKDMATFTQAGVSNKEE
ncbi:nicotinate-nucleotide--dimethylbenzimidazole phosphoribosyltransferase [Cytobacillus sp. Hm23]